MYINTIYRSGAALQQRLHVHPSGARAPCMFVQAVLVSGSECLLWINRCRLPVCVCGHACLMGYGVRLQGSQYVWLDASGWTVMCN